MRAWGGTTEALSKGASSLYLLYPVRCGLIPSAMVCLLRRSSFPLTQLTCIHGGLPLPLVEVGRHRDDGLADGAASVQLGVGEELAQDLIQGRGSLQGESACGKGRSMCSPRPTLPPRTCAATSSGYRKPRSTAEHSSVTAPSSSCPSCMQGTGGGGGRRGKGVKGHIRRQGAWV